MTEEHYFVPERSPAAEPFPRRENTDKAESKTSFEHRTGNMPKEPDKGNAEGFYPIDENMEDDDLPF